MIPISVALSLAFRETRRSRGILFFCVLSVSLGVAAITAVRGVTGAVRQGMLGQSRQLLGADFALRGNQALAGAQAERITQQLQASGARSAEGVRFYSMLARQASGSAATESAQLVRVRTFSEGFPFYGSIETEPPGAFARLSEEPSVLLDPSVSERLGLSPGDRVRLGDLSATVLGQFVKLPGTLGAEFSMAPYLMLHHRFVGQTGLLATGSRIRHERFFQLPPQASPEALKERYWEAALDENLSLQTPEDAAGNVRRFLRRLSDFLTLLGLVTLILGGLGIGSALGAFMRERVDHAAVFRCLGARPRDLAWVYGLLALIVASVGCLSGAAFGALAPLLMSGLLQQVADGLLPVQFSGTPALLAAAHGSLLGLALTLGFTLVPIWATATAPPLRVLGRATSGNASASRARTSGAVALCCGLAAVLITASLATGSAWLGIGFALSVGGALALLWGLARLGLRLGRFVGPRLPSFHLRQGVASLHRPGNQTTAVVVAVGMGFLLLGTVVTLQRSLLGLLALESRAELPNLYVIDIQPDQAPGVERLARQAGAVGFSLSPMIGARIQSVNGEALDKSAVERRAGERTRADRLRTREYFVSYRDQLLDSEEIIEGRFWSGRPAEPEVSLERSVAGSLSIGLGDRLTLDIQGLPLETVVTSIREVRWQSMQPNSMILLSPGPIEQAPKMFVGAGRVQDPARRARLQRELVAAHPNLTIIDAEQAVKTLTSLVQRLGVLFRGLALLSVLTGVVILAGAVAAGRFARQREALLLRVVGASRRDLRRILLVEYVSLAGLGLFGGWLLLEVLARVAAQTVFDMPADVPYALLGAGAAGVIGLNAAVGLLLGRSVSTRRPLDLLREG